MTILVLESADLSLVEGHLFAFDQSQEVFDYALRRSPLDRLTTAVLNLMIMTALGSRKKEADKRRLVAKLICCQGKVSSQNLVGPDHNLLPPSLQLPVG